MPDKPTGRPSSFTPEIGESICDLLTQGLSLRKVCLRDEMPAMPTVLRWLDANESFRTQYARAREIQAETLADQIVDISDDADHTDAQAVQKARLQVDARKWVASKLLPKKYGDRIQQDVEINGHVPVKVIYAPDAAETSPGT